MKAEKPIGPTDEVQSSLSLVMFMVAAMWVIELVDFLTRHRLDRWGIQPRTARGLIGIFAAPFLHGSWTHLIGNTIPFVALGSIVAITSKQLFAVAVVSIIALGGLGVWLLAPGGAVHIGASGLVFGMITFLVARGFFTKRVTHVLLGVVIFVLYGSALWGVLPGRPGVSWQGHLFGAIAGVLAAGATAAIADPQRDSK